MNFNKHSDYEGRHAIFAASRPSWLNYDDETFVARLISSYAEKTGTLLHAYAHECIQYGIKMSNTAASRRAVTLELLRNGIPGYAINENQWFLTLNEFINDAIGYRMESEEVLLYSPRFFGTADAISFYKNQLRIHDLKTGTSTPNVDQLKVYAAFFCLEYSVNPADIDILLRIYQTDNMFDTIPEADEIAEIMNKIRAFDSRVEEIQKTNKA